MNHCLGALRRQRIPRALKALPARLIAAGVALLLVLAACLLLTLRYEKEAAFDRAMADADRIAAKLASRTNEALNHVSRTTLLVKHLRATGQNNSLTAMSRDGLLSNGITLAVMVLDAEGRVLDRSDMDIGPATAPIAPAVWGEWARLSAADSPEVNVGKPLDIGTGGRWVVPVTRRLSTPSGQFAGLVVAMVDPAALTLEFSRSEDRNTVVGVLGLDGVYRSRQLDGQVSFGEQVKVDWLLSHEPDLRRRMQPVVSPVDQQNRYIVTARLDDFPLVVVVGEPTHVVFAGYDRTRSQLLRWSSVLAALIVIGTVMLSAQAYAIDRARYNARQVEAAYRTTLDGSLDTVLMMRPAYDGDGELIDFTVQQANAPAVRLFAQPVESIVGTRLHFLLPDIRDLKLFERLQEAFETGQMIEFEHTVSRHGQQRWLHHQAVPLQNGLTLITRDITDRRKAELALAEREQFYRTLVDCLPLPIYAKSMRPASHGEIVCWNRAAEKAIQITAERALGRKFSDCFPPDIVQRSDEQDREVLADPRPRRYCDLPYNSPSMGERYIDLIKAPVFGADGCVDHILIIAEDITERRRTAESLRLVSKVVTETSEAIVVTDAQDRIVMANPAFASLTGFNAKQLTGMPAVQAGLPALRDNTLNGVEDACAHNRRWAGDGFQQRADGTRFEIWLSVGTLRDDHGKLTHHTRVFSDISVLKHQQRQLAELARQDALTKLPNRRHFNEQLGQSVERARRNHQTLALLYIDLDGFKAVNDTHGHEAGDELLVEVGKRLQRCVRTTDTVARLGGDEFTVILEAAGEVHDVRRLCDRVLEQLSLPHRLTTDAGSASVTAPPSIGVALYEGGESAESLCRRADAAMYTAKRSGKARYSLVCGSETITHPGPLREVRDTRDNARVASTANHATSAFNVMNLFPVPNPGKS